LGDAVLVAGAGEGVAGQAGDADDGAVADVGVGQVAVVDGVDEGEDAAGAGDVDAWPGGDSGGGDDVLGGRAARVGLGHWAPPALRSPELMVLRASVSVRPTCWAAGRSTSRAWCSV